jgi:uncharacterized membrane protein
MIRKAFSFVTRAHVLFALIAIVVGGIFAFITPPLWGLDEPSHFARVFHIAQGDIIPVTGKNQPSSFMPDNFFELSNYRTNDILDHVADSKSVGIFSRKDVTNESTYAHLTNRKFSQSEHYFSFISGYSPISYVGAIVGVLLANLFHANIGTTLMLARLFSLLLYVVLVAFAIWILRRSKLKWLFFTLGLMPTAIFQASMITADSSLLAFSLLFFASLYVLLTAKTEKETKPMKWIVGVTAIAVPLIKINHIIISFIVLFIPTNKLGSRKYAAIFKISIMAIAIAASIFWQIAPHSIDNPNFSQRSDQMAVSQPDQISFSLHNPIKFTEAIIRSLVIFGDSYYQGLYTTISGNSIQAPIIISVALSVLMLLLGLYARDELKQIKKVLLWLNALCFVAAITIFAALYAGFTPVGWSFVDGVQGRYFIPLLAPFFMLLGVLLPIDIKVNKVSAKIITISTVVVALAVCIVYDVMALY